MKNSAENSMEIICHEETIMGKRKETTINGKTWKRIQAGQDWSDPETWWGFITIILTTGSFILAHYMGWFPEHYYTTWK